MEGCPESFRGMTDSEKAENGGVMKKEKDDYIITCGIFGIDCFGIYRRL